MQGAGELGISARQLRRWRDEVRLLGGHSATAALFNCPANVRCLPAVLPLVFVLEFRQLEGGVHVTADGDLDEDKFFRNAP